MFCGYLVKNIGFNLFNYLENCSVFYDSSKQQPFVYFKHNIAELKWDQNDDWMCARWFISMILHAIKAIPTIDAKDYYFVSENEMYKFIDKIKQENSQIQIINMTNKVVYSCRVNIRESIDWLK